MSNKNDVALQKTINVKGVELGNKIRRAMQETPEDENGRWTQVRLSKEMPLNKDHLSRVTRGKAEISIESLNRIGILLDVCFEVEIEGVNSLINVNGGRQY